MQKKQLQNKKQTNQQQSPQRKTVENVTKPVFHTMMKLPYNLTNVNTPERPKVESQLNQKLLTKTVGLILPLTTLTPLPELTPPLLITPLNLSTEETLITIPAESLTLPDLIPIPAAPLPQEGEGDPPQEDDVDMKNQKADHELPQEVDMTDVDDTRDHEDDAVAQLNHQEAVNVSEHHGHPLYERKAPHPHLLPSWKKLVNKLKQLKKPEKIILFFYLSMQPRPRYKPPEYMLYSNKLTQ